MSARRIALCGVHVTSEPFVRGLLRHGIRIDRIVTIDEAKGAANKVSGWFDYRKIADEFGIPIHYAERYDLKSEADRRFFAEQRFDLIVQGGWQRLFPEDVLATLSIGAIGLHGSADFLPRGRGRSPMNWSLIEGRRRFMLHLFLIKGGVDDGDVIDIEDFDINEFDDIETLYMKLAIVNLRMHVRVLPALMEGRVTPRPQVGTPSYYPKRTEADGRIDWDNWDVFRIHDFIRAQTRPYPGAFGTLDGRLLRIWRAQPFDTRITYPEHGYGEVVERFGDRLLVNCLGGLLLVTDWEEMTTDVKS